MPTRCDKLLAAAAAALLLLLLLSSSSSSLQLPAQHAPGLRPHAAMPPTPEAAAAAAAAGVAVPGMAPPSASVRIMQLSWVDGGIPSAPCSGPVRGAVDYSNAAVSQGRVMPHCGCCKAVEHTPRVLANRAHPPPQA